jgi:RNA polymerase sigma factor (sigma-70 family)
MAVRATIVRQRRFCRRDRGGAATQRPEEVLPHSSTQADSLIPLLNEAIENLSQGDRDAILLRYLQGCDMATVSASLATSESAARRRVERAVV